jgi:hypothetical protein
MNSSIQFGILGFCVISLSSCAMMDNRSEANLYYRAHTSYALYQNSPSYLQNTYKMPNQYDENNQQATGL